MPIPFLAAIAAIAAVAVAVIFLKRKRQCCLAERGFH